MRSVKVKLDEAGWPDSIPWPQAGEFMTDALTDGFGRCCLSGWAGVALLGRPCPIGTNCDATHAPYRVHSRMLYLAWNRGFRSYTEFNDHPVTTNADREEFWRETWEHFGYRGPR